MQVHHTSLSDENHIAHDLAMGNWKITNSLIKRSLHQFISFSISPLFSHSTPNTYILSLADPTPLASSPKLNVNINYWPTSVNLWLIHAHPVMAPSRFEAFASLGVPIIHCAMCPLIWTYQPSIPNLTLLLNSQ